MVDGLFCRNDVHLLIGEPNIGKSWITMALTVAIADRHPEFLGRAIREYGRILYIDEENPADLVYDRFRKLGLTKEGARNVRYFSNLNLRLDKADGEGLLDEAFEWEPSLVVLDALARFHTDDENHAGAMAALFYNAIKPLARETGAAVVLIHHASKTDSNSSYKRSRGSGDIVASPDAGFDLRATGINSLVMAPFKSRRVRLGEEIYISIDDKPDGRVAVENTVHIPF
jgi:RecA-family ATPase